MSGSLLQVVGGGVALAGTLYLFVAKAVGNVQAKYTRLPFVVHKSIYVALVDRHIRFTNIKDIIYTCLNIKLAHLFGDAHVYLVLRLQLKHTPQHRGAIETANLILDVFWQCNGILHIGRIAKLALINLPPFGEGEKVLYCRSC